MITLAQTAPAVKKPAEAPKAIVIKKKPAPADPVTEFFTILKDDGTREMRVGVGDLISNGFWMIFFLGSACWAASIASARRHNAFLHFFLGLIVPWIYPLVILFALTIPGQWNIADQNKPNADGDGKDAATDDPLADAPQAPAISPRDLPFEPTAEYFNAVCRDDNGLPAGPFDVVYAGNPIVVTQILEILEDMQVLNVEFYDKSPTLRKMRIPFAKIDSWKFRD